MFRTVPLSIRIRTLRPDPARKLSAQPVWHKPLLCVQWKTPDDGQRNCPKHVEFYSENKFEKLAHLVDFIIRILLSCFQSLLLRGSKIIQHKPPKYILSKSVFQFSNFDVFYMFRTRGFIFRKTAVYTVMVWYVLHACGPGNSVGIVTDYGLDGPGSNPGGDEIFRPFRPVLGPTQPPVKWVPGLSRV